MMEFFPLVIAIILLFYLWMNDTNKLTTFIIGAIIGGIISVYIVSLWFENVMKGFLRF